MSKIGLRSRLFWSHMVVMLVGLVTLTIIGKISSPRFFVIYLESIEVQGFRVQQVRKELVQGFEQAWTRGAIWSIVVGASAAGGLSYWVSRRIVHPLEQMEEITKKFATGQLDERVPSNEIPELDHLASSFNRMASTLEDVEFRRRELIGDLTHELRTPLTILSGYLEGLSDGTVASNPDVYEVLIRETSRMRRLVNDLQELSKMEAGYLPIDTKPFELQPLLTSVVQRFIDQLTPEDRHTIELICPADIRPVQADAGRVEQIMMNLLSNAVRYTPQGTITVTVWQTITDAWISVADTGKGIDPDDLPHVFERFWRADRSRDRTSGGTGIGLAICRRLVELQKGTIHVESVVGHGTTFTFSLPIVSS